ncbi:DNA translocase FtsK [Saliterribacillus persicus]|uniref:S-DNA-T family DNA segregation ATPase FtsK/SpoIIIE n=1 Tax=Saliterribacillus persicus TaxID=930114 RepID=A0A368X9E9_9BACI|nr:DNA translocase FtsK [Saliterribacillus persicus]RCW62664.1 S-DNA-T family DNA segregation ATPase FtsK/SpoIIIE [Saliterribacillus persicus]
MWKDLKTKMNRIFDEPERNQLNDNSSVRPEKKLRNTVETRMQYVYPKNSSRSDNAARKKDAKHIRKDRRVWQENISTDFNPHRFSPINQSDYKEQEEKSPQTNRNIPFRASEVPSPIHGFRDRLKKENKKESIETPAFMRNKIELKDTENLKKENTTIEEIIQSEEKNNKPLLKQTVNKNSGYEAPITKNNKITTRNKEMDKRNQEKLTSRQNPTASSVTDRKKNTGISNVRMTPRDKKNMFELKKEETIKQPVRDESFPVTEKVEKEQKIPLHLLNDQVKNGDMNDGWVQHQIELLTTTLKHFNVNATVVDALKGPSVTRFEIEPEPGVKVSKIKNLSDDIKLSLAAKDIRMEAPIPGKHRIGIEVPNPSSEPVLLQQILEEDIFTDELSPLTVALGLDIAGNPIITDLKKMPHGLIAGATGSGKSVCINTILISLLYKANHKDVKFLLIDPKMVELTPYNDLPHLVSPVITDIKAATKALKWAVNEMEDRYQKFVEEGTRDIERYNQKMISSGRVDEKMPYLVIVIDELADLMMMSPQDVEDAICRIAQKARACGIHLLLATQRPSVDVITGLIKANIPTRIAFSVSSQVDSRTILDSSGAEKLLGKGDMLLMENGTSTLQRIQGAFVSDDEIERITAYAKKIAPPEYLFEQSQLLQKIEVEENTDELYEEAIAFVLEQNSASASLLQRRFKVGYNRAARLIDMMEDNGIITGQNGSKPREVLVYESDFQQ